jgi:deoxyribodipyrimidine photolyase
MIAWWLRHDRRLSDNSCWEFALEEAAKTGEEVKVFFAWNRLHLDAGIGGIPRQPSFSPGLAALVTIKTKPA